MLLPCMPTRRSMGLASSGPTTASPLAWGPDPGSGAVLCVGLKVTEGGHSMFNRKAGHMDPGSGGSPYT